MAQNYEKNLNGNSSLAPPPPPNALVNNEGALKLIYKKNKCRPQSFLKPTETCKFQGLRGIICHVNRGRKDSSQLSLLDFMLHQLDFSFVMILEVWCPVMVTGCMEKAPQHRKSHALLERHSLQHYWRNYQYRNALTNMEGIYCVTDYSYSPDASNAIIRKVDKLHKMDRNDGECTFSYRPSKCRQRSHRI